MLFVDIVGEVRHDDLVTDVYLTGDCLSCGYGLSELLSLCDSGGLLRGLGAGTTLATGLTLLALRLDDRVEGLVEGLHSGRW